MQENLLQDISRTYSIYLKDHMSKEEDFFDKAESEVFPKKKNGYV